jgi:hypothetical protein
MHSQLKEWARRFLGVASKYLQNDMNYFIVLDAVKNLKILGVISTTKFCWHTLTKYKLTHFVQNVMP